MSDFLGALAGQISSQFSLGENTDHTLDDIDPDTGKNVKYGSLGDFAKHFDQSSERRYVEEGYLRIDPFTTEPKQFEILMQEPSATVFIKKRMFSSVGENFRLDFMNGEEKVYYKAMKILFQNKCAQVAALEKLSKIQKITESMGKVSEQLMPIIFSLSDGIGNGLGKGSNLFGAFGGADSPLQKSASSFSKKIDTIRRVYGFNKSNMTTSWITDNNNLFQSQFGQGTGVIEITNFTTLSTSVSTDSISSPGTFNISISDPYEAMLITEFDIEKAISDATNMFYNSKIFQFSKGTSTTLINDLRVRLNQVRSARNASPISFKVDADTLLGKRVTAIIDRQGIELPFDYDSTSAESIFSGGASGSGAFGGGASISDAYLKGGEIAGNDGLNPDKQKFGNIRTDADQIKTTHTGLDSELSIFSRIVSTIYSKLSLEANSQNAFQFNNAKTNYARKKLRFNFSGKLIIQPMDVVNIYISSKSRRDTKLLSGLSNMFTGVGMLQNLNNTLVDFKGAVDTLFNPSGNIPFQAEKSAFVGSEFPNSLWSLIRGQFVSENEGTHVFAGVVDSAADQWSDGKFTITIGGKDNTAYFEMGQINFKPGVDTYNGKMFDPLTPFKSSFDGISTNASGAIPELLDENKFLLGSEGSKGAERSGLIKSKLGRFAGMLVNEKDVINDRNIDPVTGKVTGVFYAPDGLAYKWKEGIGIFTQFGSSLSMNDPFSVGNPNIANKPFAGQDVMNVLSLLITGTPYNFATYYKATQDFGGAYNDPKDQKSSAHSFAASLRNDLNKSNTLWGNFIPFKNLVMDEASHVVAIATQNSVIKSNVKLDSQIKELAELNKQATLAGAINAMSDTTIQIVDDKFAANSAFDTVRNKIDILKQQIDTTMKEIVKENNNFYTGAADGDHAYFDSTDFIDMGSRENAVSDASINRLVRRKLNFYTRRMSYNIRANEDKNLFIVDDTYDKDYDILAYEKSLTDGLKLYNNEFTTVKEQIGMVAQLLNLEVFCDSQGHIRVRSPQYNRMPSSVFYKMMHLKETLGIQVFPEFLNDLFKNKLESLKTRLEILEDQIRLDCAILGSFNDAESESMINDNRIATGIGSGFSFISDPGSASQNYENGGVITQIDNLIKAANPDSTSNKAETKDINTFNKIEVQNRSTKDSFTNSQKYSLINFSLDVQALKNSGISVEPPKFLTDSRVEVLTKRIFTKSGIKINRKDYLRENSDGMLQVEIPTSGTIDVFKVADELSQKMREHQKALKLFYNTIKNAREFRYLDDKNNTGNSLITPGIYGKSSIPEVFEHMIEDETYDDYGLGSGTRYIIKRSQIISISISENPPASTMVEVQGDLDPLIPNISNEGFNALTPNGNGLTSAVAVDYDMWRTYGFRGLQRIPVPFLKDPNTQCGPYASMLLSRNRKNILKGTVVISGNEFMQVGEVVYIEDRGLLFYVTSVKHSFTFNSSFRTTLELTYGHTPGEYIPTVMDMIGKMLYNNKDVADVVVERQDTSGNDINIGVLQLSRNNDSDGGVGKSLGSGASANSSPGSFSSSNSQTINNIIYTTAYQLANNSNADNKITATIELRTYHDKKSNSSNDILLKFAHEIRNILTGKNISSSSNITVNAVNKDPKYLQESNVKLVPDTVVNLDDTSDRRSPSQRAIDAARNFIAHSKSASLGTSGVAQNDKNAAEGSDYRVQQDVIRKVLFENVVDCWLSISSKEAEGC